MDLLDQIDDLLADAKVLTADELFASSFSRLVACPAYDTRSVLFERTCWGCGFAADLDDLELCGYCAYDIRGPEYGSPPKEWKGLSGVVGCTDETFVEAFDFVAATAEARRAYQQELVDVLVEDALSYFARTRRWWPTLDDVA